MKSTIKIDVTDQGNGKGLEPVMRVQLCYDISDLRDKMLNTFFEALGGKSNTLFVKFSGGNYTGDRRYDDVEIYPLENLLVDNLDGAAGVRIGLNEEDLRKVLDESGVTYSNDGTVLTVFNVSSLFSIGMKFGQLLMAKGINYKTYLEENNLSSISRAVPSIQEKIKNTSYEK